MFTPKQAKTLQPLVLIPYYPKEHHHLVLEEIHRFAQPATWSKTPFDEQLRWLAETAVRDMKQWTGVGELRGLWCTRFPPADGVEAYSSLPGHTPRDIETENLEGNQRHYALGPEKRIDEAQAQRMLQKLCEGFPDDPKAQSILRELKNSKHKPN